MPSPENTSIPASPRPTAPPSHAQPESTGGAWLGLLLVAYGAGSILLAAVFAIPTRIAGRIHDAFRVQLELNEVEGAGGEVLQELAEEIGALMQSVIRDASIDLGVTALLGGGLLVAGLGICFRREGLRRFGVVVAWLKLASLVWLGWVLMTHWVPVMAELMRTVDELAGLASQQSGTSIHNPLALFGSEGALRTWSIVALVTTAVPSLLALWLAVCSPVRKWCNPEPFRGAGSSSAP